jgi:competence protein ComEC
MRVERHFLAAIFLGLCLGILFAELFSLGFHFILFLTLVATVSAAVLYALHFERHLRGFIILMLLGCASVVFGLARTIDIDKHFVLPQYDGTTVTLVGSVVSNPEDRGTYQTFVLLAEGILLETSCASLNERVLVRADRFEDISYGDSLRATGLLRRPQAFVTETGRVFSYDEFLKKDGIGSILSFASIEVSQRGGGSFVKRALFSIKEGYLATIARYIPEPESALLGGLTVGTRQALGNELEEDLRATGVIHIVVLSGYNVIIIAEAITRALRFLSLRTRLIVSSLAIILFTILVGAGATVVRAGIMAIAALVVRATGNEALGIRLLFFAGIIMLSLNPALLLHDPSFQLSFIATLGLILLSKHLDAFLDWIQTKSIRDVATATISTHVAVLPFLMHIIGKVSLVALPVNLLVVPLVPFAMFFGFLTGLAGFIPFVSAFLAPIFGAIAFIILSYQLFIVDLFARIPFASVFVPSFPLVFTIALYVCVGMFIKKRTRGKHASTSSYEGLPQS